MIYTLNDADSPKDVPFARLDGKTLFWVLKPYPLQKVGVHG